MLEFGSWVSLNPQHAVILSAAKDFMLEFQEILRWALNDSHGIPNHPGYRDWSLLAYAVQLHVRKLSRYAATL